MSFVPAIEQQSVEVINKFQQGKLRSLLLYLEKNSPYYQRVFSENNVNLQDIQRIDDLAQLPVTTKDDLQRHNWEFLCIPRERVVEYTSTSGTLGRPVIIALTESDLQRLGYNEAISFACADGKAGDVYQLMLTLDRQFMAGIAYYNGIRKLGGSVIRIGPGVPALQWDAITRLRPDVIVAVPSFLVKLIEYAEAHQIEVNKTSVKRAICIGESLRTPDLLPNKVASKINESWNIKLYGTYASTEMQTAFTECSHGVGGHHHPELVIVELLNDADEPVAQGEPGEITITTLGVEGMPLLRYKTGDIAYSYQEPCRCGRNTMRVGPILGRKQHMIKLKGTTLYPPGIVDIVHTVKEVKDYVIEVYSNDMGLDELRIYIATTSDSMEVKGNLTAAFQSRLRVVPEIEVVELSLLERMQGGPAERKPKKFLDKRSR